MPMEIASSASVAESPSIMAASNTPQIASLAGVPAARVDGCMAAPGAGDVPEGQGRHATTDIAAYSVLASRNADGRGEARNVRRLVAAHASSR